MSRANGSRPKGQAGDPRGEIILDEIQRIPEIFPILRVLIDWPQRRFRASIELEIHTPRSLRGLPQPAGDPNISGCREEQTQPERPP